MGKVSNLVKVFNTYAICVKAWIWVSITSPLHLLPFSIDLTSTAATKYLRCGRWSSPGNIMFILYFLAGYTSQRVKLIRGK